MSKKVQDGRRALPVKRYEGMVPIAGRRCGTIWPAVSRRERHEKLVRAEGLEPSRTLRSNGFSCHYGFRRPRLIASKVWGLDYPFAMPQISFGIRRCPSSLYTFPNRNADCSGRAWLGIAMSQGSPTLSSSTIAGFPAGTQVFA